MGCDWHLKVHRFSDFTGVLNMFVPSGLRRATALLSGGMRLLEQDLCMPATCQGVTWMFPAIKPTPIPDLELMTFLLTYSEIVLSL